MFIVNGVSGHRRSARYPRVAGWRHVPEDGGDSSRRRVARHMQMTSIFVIESVECEIGKDVEGKDGETVGDKGGIDVVGHGRRDCW